MVYPQGIAFRDTAGYVVDAANDDAELAPGGTLTYPRTTAQGNTVGWESGLLQSRNRNAGNDPRLAGAHYTEVAAAIDFRFDLPSSGSYNIRVAMGEANYARDVNCELRDTTTVLTTLTSGATSAAQRFKDATNVERTNATWPGSNLPYAATFATTICRFRIGSTASNPVAYLYVETTPAPPVPSSGLDNKHYTRQQRRHAPKYWHNIKGWFGPKTYLEGWFWRGWAPAVASGSDVTVALTGIALIASAGSLGVQFNVVPTGQAATASPGSFAATNAVPLSGHVGTFAAGSLSPAVAAVLSGASITASPGTVVPSIARDLTGSAITSAQGSLTAVANDVTLALTGIAIASGQGTVTPGTAPALSGQASTASAGSLGKTQAVPLTGRAVTVTQGDLAIDGATPPAEAPWLVFARRRDRR